MNGLQRKIACQGSGKVLHFRIPLWRFRFSIHNSESFLTSFISSYHSPRPIVAYPIHTLPRTNGAHLNTSITAPSQHYGLPSPPSLSSFYPHIQDFPQHLPSTPQSTPPSGSLQSTPPCPSFPHYRPPVPPPGTSPKTSASTHPPSSPQHLLGLPSKSHPR